MSLWHSKWWWWWLPLKALLVWWFGLFGFKTFSRRSISSFKRSFLAPIELSYLPKENAIELIKSFWPRQVLVLNCDPTKGSWRPKVSDVVTALALPPVKHQTASPLMKQFWMMTMISPPMMVLIDCEAWLWLRGLMGHRWPGSWRRRQFLLHTATP